MSTKIDTGAKERRSGPALGTGPEGNGKAKVEAARTTVLRQLTVAFWKSLPGLILILGLGVVVFLALWARFGEHGTAAKASTVGAATSTSYRLTGSGTGHVVNVTLHAREAVQEIAPGVKYHVWTFDGTAPGPVIRVHLGDTVHFTLHNDSTIGMQHSIDFHAAMTPWADLPKAGQTTLTGNYQPVNPGETKTFDWMAMYPGVFMYHCGVPPVLEHIANGMYGAIIVEPNNLPKEREYVLVSSEFYPGDKPVHGVYEGDYNKMLSANPQFVVWNGVADQYKTTPLEVRPNEKFRMWVVNAGPTLTNAFHVIGTMFNTYPDGNPANVIYGDQTYNIPPGGAAMFELQIPESGLYPFVTHAFAYTARGATGVIEVTPTAPPAPGFYPTFGDPFTAGVTPATAGVPAGAGSAGTSAGGASTAPAATATCSPSGTQLTLMAAKLAFSRSCLAAPAGKAFTVAFDNMDQGIPHNMSIYTDSTAAKPLFQGSLVTGPALTTYHVKALPKGTYYFRCDVHPQMNGTFVVK